MRAYSRVGLVSFVLSAGLGLAGCDSIDRLQDTVTGMFDTKKRLPGDRKPMFPEGVPGVTPGVPSEYLPGTKDQGTEGADPAAAKEGEAKGEKDKRDKPAAKPQRPPAAAQAPRKPPATAQQPAPAQPVQPQAAAPTSPPASASPPWPSAPPSGTIAR